MPLLACFLACAMQFEFPMQQVPMGDGPSDLAVADMDLDGRPDLLTCNNNGHDVTLRRGDGWGGFGALESFPLPSAGGRILVDDLDANGWPDVVVSLPQAHRVAVLRDDADGGLLPSVEYGAGDHPTGLASGDVDNDGDQDLLVANAWDATVSVLLGTGTGQFLPGAVVPTGDGPGVALADLDLDGILELVVPGSEALFVHAGLGHGQFGPPKPNVLFAPVADLALGDLDENGIVDAVACPPYGPTLSVLLDDGAGGFDPWTSVYIESLHQAVGALLVDFDEDEHLDVLISSLPEGPYNDEWGSTLRFFKGGGSGTVGTSVVTQVAGANAQFVAADALVDGHLDLFLIPYVSGSVLVLPGDGRGGVPALMVTESGEGGQRFGLGDANDDGLLDVALPWSNGVYALAQVSLGLGDGEFDFTWQDDVASWATVARLADVDDDGHAELVLAKGNGPVEIRAGDGTGDYGYDPTVTSPAGAGSIGLELLDVQGDGHLDLVTADEGPDTLTIALGQGNLSFAAPTQVVVGADPADLAAADLDGDGLPELVTANEGADTLTVVSFGKGSGTVPVPAGARALALGDIDEDGKDDAAVCGGGDSLSLLLGTGAGFRAFQELHPDILAVDVLLADVDGDGHLDLALSDTGRRAVALLKGAGDGSFGEPQFLGAGPHPSYIAAADLNVDGLLDLLTLWNGSTFAVHLQQEPGPFALVPGGAPGLHGPPLLKLAGSLEPGSDLVLLLQGAAPGQRVTLLAGTSALLAPFKGGVLVPDPDLALLLPATDPAGQLTLRSKWPAGVGSAVSYFAQAWLPDAVAAVGWAGSTGVGMLTP